MASNSVPRDFGSSLFVLVHNIPIFLLVLFVQEDIYMVFFYTPRRTVVILEKGTIFFFFFCRIRFRYCTTRQPVEFEDYVRVRFRNNNNKNKKKGGGNRTKLVYGMYSRTKNAYNTIV